MRKIAYKFFTLSSLMVLTGCTEYQNSHSGIDNTHRSTITGVTAGAIMGSVAHSLPPYSVAGASIGALTSATPTGLNRRLLVSGVQVVRHGDNVRIVLPTDEVFKFNEARLRSKFFPVMNDVVSLVQYFGRTNITVACYHDDVDRSHEHAELSQHRAEAIKAYLWTHGINHQWLHAVGMGSKDPIADNLRLMGQTYNRRVEITLRSSRWPGAL